MLIADISTKDCDGVRVADVVISPIGLKAVNMRCAIMMLHKSMY
jgi:hypothetical protein